MLLPKDNSLEVLDKVETEVGFKGKLRINLISLFSINEPCEDSLKSNGGIEIAPSSYFVGW